jgi:hypothetical protein
MYPSRELIQLAAYKAVLRRDIAVHRNRCAQAAARVAQPLEWLDRTLVFWRRLSPLAKFAVVPLGLLIQRIAFPRLKILRSVLRWSPLVFGAIGAIGRTAGIGARASKSSNGQLVSGA